MEPANLTGRVAVVTGATGGIGKEIARGLARRGAEVVVAARDTTRGGEVAAELIATEPAARPGRIVVMKVDVADQASLRAFAAEASESFPAVHMLVNNAGAWSTEQRRGPDGIELTLATNVLGPYLLTELLADRLRAADRARVINLASSIASNYDATDLQFERRGYDGFKAYAQSKQAIRMLTWGHAERFAGSGVTVNAASPGFVKTRLNRDARGWFATISNVSAALFAVSPAKGADTPLWAATDPALDGVTGKYFEKRAVKDGGFADVDAVTDLLRRCDELTRASAAP